MRLSCGMEGPMAVSVLNAVRRWHPLDRWTATLRRRPNAVSEVHSEYGGGVRRFSSDPTAVSTSNQQVGEAACAGGANRTGAPLTACRGACVVPGFPVGFIEGSPLPFPDAPPG